MFGLSTFRVRICAREYSKIIRAYSSKSKLTDNSSNSLEPLKQIVPPPKIHRVTYEYPPPPKQASKVPSESSAWKRHIPLIIGVGGLLWAGYAVYFFFGDSGSEEQTVLNPVTFSPFRITHKERLSDDTVLIELAPKYAASHKMLSSGATLWNGKKLWSVQVKHPMIQIARNYTPLPLYFMQSDRAKESPLLRIMGTAEDEGKLCLLVKRYADGEMSRYLHSLPVGSDVELRGPFVDHKFPYGPADSQPLRQPMLDVPTRMPAEAELDPGSGIVRAPNLAMFTAGTGITTALQMLLSPHNPPRGFTHVFHSAATRADIPFERFMLFLESAGRAKFHIYIDEEGKFINSNDIPRWAPLSKSRTGEDDGLKSTMTSSASEKHQSVVQQFADMNCRTDTTSTSYAVVCGPPGYIAYVSGDPGIDGTNPIGGLLGNRGWTMKNTKRLLDL